MLQCYLRDRTARILDVGCGSGQVGHALAAWGYVAVDGVDLSPAMLTVAARKACYRALVLADVDELPPTAFPDAHYDAAICVGTFTPHHVGLAGLRETIRYHSYLVDIIFLPHFVLKLTTCYACVCFAMGMPDAWIPIVLIDFKICLPPL